MGHLISGLWSGPFLIVKLGHLEARKANYRDNVVAESIFKNLKAEMVYHRKFTDQQSAKLETFGYIGGFYNTQRSHSAIGYKTPKQFEEMLLEKEKMAT